MAIFYARLINHHNFNYHIVFSASFYIVKDEHQRGDETDLFNKLNIKHIITKTDISNIDFKSHLEHQIQIQETREIGWIFDKVISMKKKHFIKLVNQMVRIMLISF